MRVTFGERLIAYLVLLSGLSISAVAIYYSVVGLASIFAAASVSVIVMGLILEVSKLITTVWLKINWRIASLSIRVYLIVAIGVLMLITSMGIFGFLSRAHSDQTITNSGITAELAVYDEKIQTAKENIDAGRKALKQMDEAVDQTMGRSTTEVGASKAVQIRRSQQAERSRIAQDIEAEQKKINQLMEERAPVAAEVRKVEAEVGPIKYLAEFFYGTADSKILEKSVTWVIVILIVVFDPLAIILLLAAQSSFQDIRARDEEFHMDYSDSYPWVYSDDEDRNDDGFSDKITEESTTDVIKQPNLSEVDTLVAETNKSVLEQHPYLNRPFVHFKNLTPITSRNDSTDTNVSIVSEDIHDRPGDYLSNVTSFSKDFLVRYVQNEEQHESGLWSTVSTNTAATITQGEYIKSSQERTKDNL
jgi:hypothetical protein